jgi:hypothetical protein
LVWSDWYDYNEASVRKNASPNIGVYEVADSSVDTVYCGEGELQSRLLEHLAKKELPLGIYFRHEKTNDKDTAVRRQKEHLAAYRKIYGKLPMYNERLR